jgi:peroxiredoxin
MAQLRHDHQQFVNRDTEIIAIGPEKADAFKKWWDEHQMPFTGVADPQHVIADTYGQQVKLVKLGRMPASLLIDKNGRIRYSHYGESMSDIPENREVLAVIDELNTEKSDSIS